MSKNLPVLVVGLGPAGASTAIFLAQLGLPVTAIDRKPRSGLQIGESLPPDAKKLLEQLGVWREFDSAPHEKCYGNRSYWWSDKAQYHDFMQHPVGHGWHIDRPGFETMLRKQARSLGVDMDLNSSIGALDFDGRAWSVLLARNGQPPSDQAYSFIVDATGRNSWVARRQGVVRLYEDRQLALVAFLHSKSPFPDTTTLVETNLSGWWYSAKIPGNRVATAFLCRPDKTQKTLWTTPSGWWNLIAQAKQTMRRLASSDFELLEAPKFVAADSSILERVQHSGWLAVGDAAMTYDPIASHGLMMSMVSARDAAAAIHMTLNGSQEAQEQYGQQMYQAFMTYSELRKTFIQ
jgi:2-polyprenyl-6-methoxyphenol hydroxylase-like FAD-dependent oxidoreductase